MSQIVVTMDLDWACEPAVEETLDFLKSLNISPTVFVTHRSACVEASMHELEVGVHPYFNPESSQGSSIEAVVNHVMDLPHNLPAFRCHRFASCNVSREALAKAGMLISSNVCTDLEVISPFRDRCGLLEVPIFMEDGGYLWRKHSLEMDSHLKEKILGQGTKVLLIHPMHFSLNTPDLSYMKQIKQSISRKEWNEMSHKTLNDLRWKGRGIRNLLTEILQMVPKRSSFKELLAKG